SNSQAVFTYLQNFGIPHIAITNGSEPIEYYSEEKFGQLAVPVIQAVDTLGAGDIFHGAFCHYILRENFELSLSAAGQIASHACQYFGTRKWLHHQL
ncbi:MAG: PfkB family carbohydrate kinase, partial [Snowella sp.]